MFQGMEPFYFVLAWLAYVACFSLGVLLFDRHQTGRPARQENRPES
jgi:hypothetical protein